jgi:hypothetical protein
MAPTQSDEIIGVWAILAIAWKGKEKIAKSPTRKRIQAMRMPKS